MSWNEEVFEVQGADGVTRRGVLTRAEHAGEVAAILLPAGLKDRVGPHRLHVHLARTLAARGITTLRFDPKGIGESDGLLETAFNGRHYRAIQQGLLVDDTLLAMHALGAATGARRFILAGLCGGAMTAQLTAAREPERIAGVMSLSAVAVLDEERPGVVAATRSETLSHARGYLAKLFSPQAWLRLLRGEAGPGNALRTLRALCHLALVRLGLARRRASNENPMFFRSFERLERNAIPHLMIFGGSDARWLAFRELVVDGHLGGRMTGRGYHIHVVADANHEFQSRAWQQELLHTLLEWLAATRILPAADAAPAQPAQGVN